MCIRDRVRAVIVDEVLHPRRQLYRLIEALLVRLRVLVQVGGDVPRHGLLCSLCLLYTSLGHFCEELPQDTEHLADRHLLAELLPPELGGVDDASLHETGFFKYGGIVLPLSLIHICGRE